MFILIIIKKKYILYITIYKNEKLNEFKQNKKKKQKQYY